MDFEKKTIMDFKEIDFNEMDFKEIDFKETILSKGIFKEMYFCRKQILWKLYRLNR